MSVGTRPNRPPARARARAAALLLAFAAIVGALGPLGAGQPAGAADRGSPSALGLNAGFGGSASSANARYLVDTYQVLLGRAVDEAGLDYQLNVIKAGGDRSRRTVTYGLLFSAEGSRQEVQRAYADLLRRTPDGNGENYWTTHLQTRGLLDLRVLLLASDEYHAIAGGTDAVWLDALYHDVLGRPIDDLGRAYWLDLAYQGVPRALIVAGIYLSDEALGGRVDAYYGEALGRGPSTGERNGAISIIRSDGERGLRAQLWASDERFEHYLQPVLT